MKKRKTKKTKSLNEEDESEKLDDDRKTDVEKRKNGQG